MAYGEPLDLYNRNFMFLYLISLGKNYDFSRKTEEKKMDKKMGSP